MFFKQHANKDKIDAYVHGSISNKYLEINPKNRSLQINLGTFK